MTDTTPNGLTGICGRCRTRGKTWRGSNPDCAFKGPVFDSDNWNCATMNELRYRATGSAVWSEDQYAAILPWDGYFIVLGWYKHRGRTEYAGLLSDEGIAPLALDDAEAFLSGASRPTAGEIADGGADATVPPPADLLKGDASSAAVPLEERRDE